MAQTGAVVPVDLREGGFPGLGGQQGASPQGIVPEIFSKRNDGSRLCFVSAYIGFFLYFKDVMFWLVGNVCEACPGLLVTLNLQFLHLFDNLRVIEML